MVFWHLDKGCVCVFGECWFMGVSEPRPKSMRIFTFQNAFHSASHFIPTIYLQGDRKVKGTPFHM